MTTSARVEQVAGQLRRPGLVQGEVVIITGAGQGIGRKAALQLAREGAHVVVNDLDQEKCNAVACEIEKLGARAVAVPGSVTSVDFPDGIVRQAVKAFGKINHLILNAGFCHDKMIHTMDDAAFDIMYDVHNKAPFRLVRAAAPYFRIKDATRRENRSIVLVSSQSGTHGMVGQANYATAKAGVLGLMRVIAKEWGPFGIRCNTISFGHISTRLTGAKESGEGVIVDGKKILVGIPTTGNGGQEQQEIEAAIPLGRYGTPSEAASAMLFLCSSLASYVSGQNLEVAGGKNL